MNELAAECWCGVDAFVDEPIVSFRAPPRCRVSRVATQADKIDFTQKPCTNTEGRKREKRRKNKIDARAKT